MKAMKPGFGLRFSYQVDGVSVPLKHSVGWCHACDWFASVEVFDSPEELLTLEGKLPTVRLQLPEAGTFLPARYDPRAAIAQAWFT